MNKFEFIRPNSQSSIRNLTIEIGIGKIKNLPTLQPEQNNNQDILVHIVWML